MKKNKSIIIILTLLIMLFSAFTAKKTFENDTFFTIAVGNKILDQGIYTEEDFTWHEGLKYQNVRWMFDILIATLYNNFGYVGIYVFVILMKTLIGVTIFYVLTKQKNNIFLSFVLTIQTLIVANGVFSARAQMISFFIFILEYYFLCKLLESNKKRYGIVLVLLSALLANTHASVYPLYFVFYLPYIAEIILYKILSISKDSEDKKVELKPRKGIKLMLIIMIISALAGLITPIGTAPYVNIFKTVNEISSEIIAEMRPLTPVNDYIVIVYLVIIIGIIGFTKVKPELPDLLYILGFTLLSLSAIRSRYFFFLIGIFPIAKIITLFFETYEFKIQITDKQKIIIVIIASIIILPASINEFVKILSTDYLDRELLPVDATEFILNNLDTSNMRLFNEFNFGSYLEFKGIPVFLDSRAEIYLNTFNDTNILFDWQDAKYDLNYKQVFDKYDVNYVIVYKSGNISKLLYNDLEWKLIYMDDGYSIYKKI